MKLVVNIKLKPTQEQATALRRTLETANEACNYLSNLSWDTKTFGQYALHKLAYRETKDKFRLTAQMVVRSIAKVADAYKLNTKTKRCFREYSAQPFDERIIRFAKDDIVSIWTIAGRQKIPFVMGEYQRKLFAFRKGEVDLIMTDRVFYLACVCDIDDPELIKTTDILGVDFGVINIAADSNGKTYSGKAININRCKLSHRRKNLQKKKTRSAKRKLKKISKQQERFQKNANHVISKEIVLDAKRTVSAIALEDLGGIRKRVTARKQQRARLSNWGFAQLRTFVVYKARQVGIPVILVDPKNTSRECPKCGSIDKKNRKTRDEFVCVRCGFAGPADTIAAWNIRSRARAVVNQPMVSSVCAISHDPSETSRLL
jgi:IS605 OrfB family transposase